MKVRVEEKKTGRAGDAEWKLQLNCKATHYPRLDTVMRVAHTLKEDGPCTKTELSRNLKKTVMWPTLTLILAYFEAMGFTVKDRKGSIVWIHNPKLVKKYAGRDDLNYEKKYSGGK